MMQADPTPGLPTHATPAGLKPAIGDAARLLGFTDVADPAQGSAGITASIVTAETYAGWTDAFATLSRHATAANPFMSPAVVAAARRRFPHDDIFVLAARDVLTAGAPLTGVWVLRATRDIWTLGARVLQVPVEPEYDPLSAPVLATGRERASLKALTDLIAQQTDAPRVVRAGSWPLAGTAQLADGARLTTAETWERAVLAPPAGATCEDYLRAAMGGAYKKRLAQERALAREGRLAIATYRGGAAVDTVTRFIDLEDTGWKGAAGTSLARRPADAAYLRGCAAGFADCDRLAVDAILLDDRPVALGLVVEAGGHSLFWKTTFDERHRKHSPGVLLDMAVTRRLFAEQRPSLDSGMMEFTDPASQIWSERQPLARACIELGSPGGAGLAGLAARAGKRARHALRRLHRSLRPAS